MSLKKQGEGIGGVSRGLSDIFLGTAEFLKNNKDTINSTVELAKTTADTVGKIKDFSNVISESKELERLQAIKKQIESMPANDDENKDVYRELVRRVTQSEDTQSEDTRSDLPTIKEGSGIIKF